MKKLYFSLLALIFFLFCNAAFAQKPIPFGSNNGKYINIRNTNIYYEEYGKGVPLILLHGGMGSIADYALCIPDLSKHFHVIAPDDPGMARSGMYDTISYEILADYYADMIDKLKLDSAYVMGWSDGGNAALILAAKRPDKIKKVITSGANYKLSGYNFGDSNSLKPVAADYTPTPDEQKWFDSVFVANKTQWKKIVNDRIKMWSQEIYFSPQFLQQINVPVMLVIGDRDAVTLEHGVEMHHLVKNSQFCVLPNTSHNIFSEKPQLINELAIDFFEQ
ncbi:alpha/beta fold hydrolase [soil metagenome]